MTQDGTDYGLSDEEKLAIVYGEDYVDVTDDVQCYEKGKTFSCECGQDFGVVHEQQATKCPSCNRYCVDTESDSRGPPEREEGQTGLNQWT